MLQRYAMISAPAARGRGAVLLEARIIFLSGEIYQEGRRSGFCAWL